MDPTQKYNGFLFDPRCSPPTSSGEIVRVVSALCCKQTQKLMVKHNFPGGVTDAPASAPHKPFKAGSLHESAAHDFLYWEELGTVTRSITCQRFFSQRVCCLPRLVVTVEAPTTYFMIQ